jgi:hypothetical protein
MRKNGPVSRTTRYRRMREAMRLGCSVGALPDLRGRHGGQPSGGSHPRWNREKMTNGHGYVLIRVGRNHPLADPNGCACEHRIVWCAADRREP